MVEESWDISKVLGREGLGDRRFSNTPVKRLNFFQKHHF
jgi:hypothetical protein